MGALNHVHFGGRPGEIYLQTGASISLLSCAIVIASYLRRRRWRRHPNPVLFWKAVVDLVYAVRFIFEWDVLVSAAGCRGLAALTQFCMIASECWFVNMSLDLYRCTTNPFTNVKQNMRWYHAFSWGTGALFGAALWLSSPEFDQDQDPFCYVTERDTTLQLVYYVVVVLSVVCALGFAILENQSYPHGGMKEALQAKKDVIRSARIFTTAYIIYQIVLISLWVADMVLYDVHSVRVKPIRDATFFIQASKGLMDLVIWVSMNGNTLRRQRVEVPASSNDVPAIESSADDQFSDVNIDLEPQLNLELRKEVLHFTTRGVVAASSNASRVSSRRHVVRLRLHELGIVVRFNDFLPRAFREIRRGFGIDEDLYRKSFLATCHERIEPGGSSGAFMFYTADYMFLVKTVTSTERGVLLRMLPSYIKHMQTNPGSHLTRYYGCHSIEMYGQVFSFAVMGNVIGRVSMHQFYDIKGSWIDRNAKPIPPGKTVICTYCSNAFRSGSTEPCQYSIHGTHLPHTVLKDNDFHRKLRVLPETAQEIVRQLDVDTKFLRSQGITDYSLLLSIHSTKYVVDHASDDISQLATRHTKRRVHYAVCHPEDQDRGDSTNDIAALNVNVEVVDATDSCSSEEDDTVSSPSRARDVLKPFVKAKSAFMDRTFRYSVLNHQEDNDSAESGTPLLARTESIPVYGEGSTPHHASESTWIGTRSIDKPGYQAYAVIGPDYYTLGVVDMLQTWTLEKRLERFWKVWIMRRDPNGISAAPPGRYAARFQRKMREIMMVPNETVGFGHQ